MILIGLVARWLASQFLRGGSFGVVGDIALGAVGALVGGFLFRQLSPPGGGGLIGGLIMATIGAVILLLDARGRARLAGPPLRARGEAVDHRL